MKHNVFKYVAVFAVVLTTAFTAQAQYNDDGGVKTLKTVEGPDEETGLYTITLETFATGETTVKPLDIVLVLDRSGSMNDPYKPTENRTWSTSDIQNYGKTLYYREAAPNNANYAYDYFELRINNRQIQGRNTLNGSWGDVNLGSSYSGVLYTDIKLPALKEAVNAFIAKIDEKDKLGGSKRIGNRISIVTFAANGSSATLSNWTYLGNAALDINNQTGYNTLTSNVNNITAVGATYANQGMQRASNLINSARTNAIKTVVLFTDGVPGDGKWSSSTASTVANGAINYANTIKGTDGSSATIWTVGLFEPMTASEKSNTDTYMSRVSSNYVGVSNMTSSATPVSDKYYIEVGDGDSLTEIFESVAEASATNLDATTQVRDVVSNSFVIPEGYDPDEVMVYTQSALTETTWGDRVVFDDATVQFYDVDKDGKRVGVDVGAGTKTNRAIVVEGFDFGAADTSLGAGDGNWVGQRYNSTQGYFWAGKKLVIELKIKSNAEATGGAGTATNASTSGVYKYDKETGEYTCINNYNVPHTTLSVNIKIRKTGLRHGESATFEILMIRPKGYNPDGETDKEKTANLVYNVIGKPVPDTHPYDGEAEEPDGSDRYEGMGWKVFKKVILTNKGIDGAEVVKDVLALDPYYVYMVLEDDWGWAYTMEGDASQVGADGTYTTSSVEVNPFRFHNTEKTDAVKHAEAIMINHFHYTVNGGEFDGKQEEHYKSSKVESFTTPTN